MKAKTKIVTLQASALKIHRVAQREIVPSKLKQLMAELDLDAIGVLHAVDYPIDGQPGPWIIDGQHRWQALMDHGFGEWEVRVLVHLDVDDHRRASELFLRLNNRVPVGPFDRFRNEVLAGNSAAIVAQQTARDHGLEIASVSGDGKVCCVNTLKKLAGMNVLPAVLGTAVAAWGRTASAVEGKLLEGIGLVFSQYGSALDRPALLKKLGKYPGGASALIGNAKGMRVHRKTSLPRCVAATIIEAYNAGRRAGQLEPL